MTVNASYVIKKNMDSVHRRWKWLKLGQHLGTAGTLFCLAWFLIQFTAWQGVLTQAWLFYLLVALLVWGAVLIFFIITFVVIATQAKRPWLADSLEKACPGMMDRVATLVFLEERRPSLQMIPIKRKIEEQAVQVLEKEKLANPFSTDRTLLHLGLFALALLGVIFFQYHFSPFAQLLAPPVAVTPASAKPDSPFELAARDVTETREKKVWGEVKIVDPGRDVKLNKIDVLPLQIEMATSAAMQTPAWITSINGEADVPHPLAAPTDPNYAVYQPMVYLDEFKVSEWDVISYYAKVQTGDQTEYASKMYFVEIRPFREDLLKSMGKKGDKGKAYQLLNELTSLIHQQTDILQQTHIHQQTPYATDELRTQDSKKLTEAEADLAVATNHFFAKIASEQENSDIGEILNQLTLAEQEMDRATEALRDEVIAEGKQREQAALADLIASRKAFQKAVSNGAFDGGGNNPDDGEDPAVTAGESKKALSQVSEMHDRDKATLQELHQLTERQKSLAKTPRAGWSQSQKEMRNNLDKMIKDNPDLFRGSEKEQTDARENMEGALATMNGSGNDTWGTSRYITRAGESLGDLEKVVSKNHEAQQLAQAYALKKIIDQNIKQLGQEQAKPGSMSGDEAKTVADTAQKSTDTLKEITDGMSGSGFGPGLKQSLANDNKQALDQALQQLGQAQDGAARGSAAGSAQAGLQKVSQAFDQSQPSLTKQARSHDQFQPPPGDSLDQAAQQLRSLIAAQEGQHKPSAADEAKAEAEILHNIQAGLIDPKTEGHPEKAELVAEMETLLKEKANAPVDPVVLKKLLDQIEAVRIEANDVNGAKPTEPATTYVDPAKLPPAYRDRIRNYFEQLSGQSK